MPAARQSLGADRRATVSIIFAFCLLPLVIAISAAVDFSRLVDSRAALQRAVDNAALSGAAAYSVNAAAAQTKAVVSATAVFCQMSAKMPAGSAVTGTGNQTCPNVLGSPTVTTQVGGFVAGTRGITPSSCSATNPVVSGVTCGFIVTVSASATITTILPYVFGTTKTLTATGIAANPFIDIGNALTTQLYGSAWNTNNIWVYPVLLDNTGAPDFTTNPGAIPGLPSGVYPADASPSGCSSATSCGSIGSPGGVNCKSNSLQTGCSAAPPPGCTDSPTQFICGTFTMLASTYYNSPQMPCYVSAPCYPNGPGTYPEIIAGIVQAPQAPPAVITATTPIGIAFESIAGGTTNGYGYSNGGKTQQNGCYTPGTAVYNTFSQEFDNKTNIYPADFAVDWPKITHWFYSSYLANPTPLPPSEGEVLSQIYPLTNSQGTKFNTRIPTVPQYSSTTGTWSPVPATCAVNSATYDQFITTTYPTSGSSNGSLFILKQPAGTPYTPAASTVYQGVYFTPSATPGYQYAALSCQAYGNSVFTFYWNDMGGQSDNLNYEDGTVRIACNGTSFVLLIG